MTAKIVFYEKYSIRYGSFKDARDDYIKLLCNGWHPVNISLIEEEK